MQEIVNHRWAEMAHILVTKEIPLKIIKILVCFFFVFDPKHPHAHTVFELRLVRFEVDCTSSIFILSFVIIFLDFLFFVFKTLNFILSPSTSTFYMSDFLQHLGSKTLLYDEIILEVAANFFSLH